MSPYFFSMYSLQTETASHILRGYPQNQEINLRGDYHPILSHVLPNAPFSRFQQEGPVPLSGPLVSLLFRLSLPFLCLSLLRLQVSYLVICPSICVEIQVMHLGKENQRSDSLFLLHRIRWYMISIYPITNDVCFATLICVFFTFLFLPMLIVSKFAIPHQTFNFSIH